MNEPVLSVVTSSQKLEVADEAVLLERATRDWYRDDDIGKPDQVWAKVPKPAAANVRAILRTPDFTTGDDYFIWHCRGRQDVILLCRCLQHLSGVNYWGIGKPRKRPTSTPPYTV